MKKALLTLAAVSLMTTAAMAQAGVTRMAKKGEVAVAQLKAANQTSSKRVDAKAMKRGVKAMDNPIWADTMSYCGDGEYYNSIGLGSDTVTMHWAIKVEAAAMAGRNNITAVDLFVPYAGTYTMNIVFGAEPTGTAAYTQTMTAVAADTMTWKSVGLTAPVPVVAGQPMWVVFTNTGIPYPAASVQGSTYPNGTYVSMDGVDWQPLTTMAPNLNVMWMIRVVSDTYTVQMPMVQLEGPATVLMGEAATYIVSSPNSDSYEWHLDGTTLSETSDTLIHTFTSDGTYELVAGGTNTAGTTYDTLNVNVVDCSQPISTFPHVEGFESAVPCWTFVSADPANDSHTGVIDLGTDAFEGTGVYALSSYSRAEDYNQFLISPEISLTEGTDYVVRFRYLGDDADDAFRVRVSTTTADTAAFTTVLADLPEVATQWTEAAYVLPAATKYVAINYYGNYAYYLYIDQFEISEMGAPSVTIAGPTSVGSGNGATFTAHALLADSLAWHVDDAYLATAGHNATFTTTFATGTHRVVIEAINDYGSAYDTLSVDVFNCDGTTLPYSPDFSNGLGCWFSESRLTQGMGWFASVEAMQDPIGQVVSLSAQSSFFGVTDVPTDNWLFSPVITMPATGSFELAWQVIAFGGASYPGDHYSVYTISGTDTVLLFSETLTDNEAEFSQRIAMLPATLSGDFRIAFRHHECTGGYAIGLDQIQLRAPSPAIVTLRGQDTVVVGTAVTFTAVSSNADSYAWTVDGTAVSETSATLTHTFTTAGSHTVEVTATNTIGSNSASMNVVAIDCGISQFPYENSFEDAAHNLCWTLYANDPVDYGFNISTNPEYARTGSSCLVGAYSDDVNVDQWAISPAITLPAEAANFTLSWYAMLTNWEGIVSDYEVLLSTTGNAQADFTVTLHSEADSSNHQFVYRSVSLADYAGQTIYIAFHNKTAVGGDAMIIDDLRIGEGEVGIDDVVVSAVSVSPNPATGMVTVRAEGIEGRVNVEIVDLNGRTVMQQQGNAASYRFDVSNLAAGAYFVRLTGENTNAVKKLIVK